MRKLQTFIVFFVTSKLVEPLWNLLLNWQDLLITCAGCELRDMDVVGRVKKLRGRMVQRTEDQAGGQSGSQQAVSW